MSFIINNFNCRQTIATFFEYSYADRSFVSDVQARPDNTTYVSCHSWSAKRAIEDAFI